MTSVQQTSLFDSAPPEQLLSLDGDVSLFTQWLPATLADAYFRELLETLEWQQSRIHIHGQEHAIPRLNAWYGDPECRYGYSGTRFEPLPWTETLTDIKERLTATLGVAFNSMLANRYRDGRDSVAWHSDDEPELGRNPVIASVSLGAARRFTLKHKSRRDIRPLAVDLTHGSLLVMSGPTQHHWLHQVAKTTRIVGERINLTFRYIYQ
jgi:alkylated DNA repair dioxygenase AlkB